MSNHRRYFRLWLIAAVWATVTLAGCRPPGPSDDAASQSAEAPIPDLGSADDRRDCGELGLDCVGPLNIGDCIEGQCQPRLGFECTSPTLTPTPTCDAYCTLVGSVCAPNSCDGATAWGWAGDQATADIYCLDSYKAEAIPLNVACDEPLEGLATTLRCCCEYN